MKVILGTAILAASLAANAVAQDGKAVPDAQVESNVLRALASAPELSTQNIKTTTVYGVVTLSGSVDSEPARIKAEQLAARAAGVQKVIDELTLGSSPAPADGSANADPNAGMVLQSDGTYAPAPADSGAAAAPSYPEQATNTPPAPPAPASSASYPPRRPMYNNGPAYGPPPAAPGGQVAGRQVTIPSGAVLRIRINQGLSTKHTQPGSIFDGTVLTDVVADGAVAIPRGAAVQGTVVESKDSGALKGRGELSLQLTHLTLGGQQYTLLSDTWVRDGKDKSLHTVNSALGLGALGALIGAGAGGGAGAAIGAGIGAGAGIASSAASPDGKVIIPPEAVLTFHLSQPAQVATVSEQEMARLSYAAGPGPRPVPRRYVAGPYYGPGPYYYGR